MHWYDWLASATSIVAIGGSFWAAGWKVLRKQIHQVCTEVVADIQADVQSVKLKLAAETGGNSNGLRQKVNEVSEDVAKVIGVVETLQKLIK